MIKQWEFNYHINLHYSQTALEEVQEYRKFNYHINLHYSQTIDPIYKVITGFNYHINLHYSQTRTLETVWLQ